jgi:FAD synthase
MAWSPSEIVAIGEFHGVNMGHRVRSQEAESRIQEKNMESCIALYS